MSRVLTELKAMIQRTEKELEILREDFEHANSNDVWRQGAIAHNISLKVAELNALNNFAKRIMRVGDQ